MALKVTYDHPDFPKGHEFEIRGLGLIKNGESVTISEQQEQSFLSVTGQALKEATKDNEAFKVEGTAEVKAEKPAEDKGGES